MRKMPSTTMLCKTLLWVALHNLRHKQAMVATIAHFSLSSVQILLQKKLAKNTNLLKTIQLLNMRIESTSLPTP